MIDYPQLVDNLSVGTIVINRAMEVVLWNRWMENHSHIPREQILGKVLTEEFPALKQKGIHWKVQTVFRLGSFAFFSQKLHQFLFEFENTKYFRPTLPYMQQSVVLVPLKGPDGTVEHVCISVFDVTDSVLLQQQLIESKRKVEDLSKIDELTQINNRRHLMTRLNEELAVHDRSGCVLSVILLDVDLFKNVNDLRGHICGDYVLRELAGILTSQLRQYDILGRYGGEEFGVVVPGGGIDQALVVAERLRSEVEKFTFECDNNKFNVTISLGLASTRGNLQATPQELFKVADECLYRAKASGRNCIIAPEYKGDSIAENSAKCAGPRDVLTKTSPASS